ncbi:MAG: undecaprenyl/decaprenyl-phosphate alpha-N-acetylglucosaminyl 1-phosphate transferase [Armatimonadetes bacterium]|nr:undecaprenyl/decaprenyl-phosphate alpha-N-acetylglucosaminyl 1-phosphate transferase [Armatimonadota bacterium]
MKTIFAVFLIALVSTYWLTPWARELARRKGVLAIPDPRRVHKSPTPLWGGIAIYLGALIAIAFGLGRLSLLAPSLVVFLDRALPVIGIVAVGGLVLAMGLLDDRANLSPKVQAGFLLLAGLLVQIFGVQIVGFTNPFAQSTSGGFDASRYVPLGWLAVPVTAIWIFVVSKTMDTIDGIDGLAAGVGAIAGMTLALLALQTANATNQPYPHWLIAIAAAAITGSAAGFLRHNFNPATVFMGTGGAQFLGFMLASLSILGAFKAAAAFSILVPVLVFGLPLLDAAVVVVRRALSGQPIAQADKRHIHHQLLERGLNQRQAVIVLYAVAAAFGALALLLTRRG